MRRAAELWVWAYSQGKVTAPPNELNADLIFVAQAGLLAMPYAMVIAATTNVRHINMFMAAQVWQSILP